MKSIILFITAVMLCLSMIVNFILIKNMFDLPCGPPDKPPLAPYEAEWIGGCDGGQWIIITELTDKSITIQNYGWDGSKLIDEVVFDCPDCPFSLSSLGKRMIYKLLRINHYAFETDNGLVHLKRGFIKYSIYPFDTNKTKK